MLRFGTDANASKYLIPGSRSDFTLIESTTRFPYAKNDFVGPRATPLQIAVYNRREDLVQILLQGGATDWDAHIQGPNGYITVSTLDMVKMIGDREEWMVRNVEQNKSISRSILEVLLRFGYHHIRDDRKLLLRALRHAVLQDRQDWQDLARVMFEQLPGLKRDTTFAPYMLFEAAATLQSSAMIDFLTSLGFGIHRTAYFNGLGSVIAVAANQSNLSLIRHILNRTPT